MCLISMIFGNPSRPSWPSIMKADSWRKLMIYFEFVKWNMKQTMGIYLSPKAHENISLIIPVNNFSSLYIKCRKLVFIIKLLYMYMPIFKKSEMRHYSLYTYKPKHCKRENCYRIVVLIGSRKIIKKRL